MSNQNKSRGQGNPRGLRTSDARGMKMPAKQARPNSGLPTNTQPLQQVAELGLSDGKEQVGQLAQQATDIATHAAKATANTVTRVTRATRDALGRTGTAALAMARANPVPLALTGIGVACAGIGVSWLLMSKGGAAPKASDLAHRAGAQATQRKL